jgi:hypothetical protein
VACIDTTASARKPRPSIAFNACCTTGIRLMVSVASSGGRTNGTSAPHLRAVSAISSSSVETMTRSSRLASRAAPMAQAMSGRPATSTRFLRGIDFDPPRAGMTASTFMAWIVAGPVR